MAANDLGEDSTHPKHDCKLFKFLQNLKRLVSLVEDVKETKVAQRISHDLIAAGTQVLAPRINLQREARAFWCIQNSIHPR